MTGTLRGMFLPAFRLAGGLVARCRAGSPDAAAAEERAGPSQPAPFRSPDPAKTGRGKPGGARHSHTGCGAGRPIWHCLTHSRRPPKHACPTNRSRHSTPLRFRGPIGATGCASRKAEGLTISADFRPSRLALGGTACRGNGLRAGASGTKRLEVALSQSVRPLERDGGRKCRSWRVKLPQNGAGIRTFAADSHLFTSGLHFQAWTRGARSRGSCQPDRAGRCWNRMPCRISKDDLGERCLPAPWRDWFIAASAAKERGHGPGSAIFGLNIGRGRKGDPGMGAFWPSESCWRGPFDAAISFEDSGARDGTGTYHHSAAGLGRKDGLKERRWTAAVAARIVAAAGLRHRWQPGR